jgi:hypothetical protein
LRSIVGLLTSAGCSKRFLWKCSWTSVYISKSNSDNFDSKFINIKNTGVSKGDESNKINVVDSKVFNPKDIQLVAIIQLKSIQKVAFLYL